MSYAGDISVEECWSRLGSKTNAQLVDVRTVPEWSFVGVPLLDAVGKSALFVEWQRYPAMELNPGFVDEVVGGLNKRGGGPNDEVYMLCRSGVRSIAAAQALTGAGYSAVFNVAGGFEGDKNHEGRRATLAGWKFSGLPWRQ